MTYAEKMRTEGRQVGRQEGRYEGRLQDKQQVLGKRFSSGYSQETFLETTRRFGENINLFQ